jgi:hypothetical protein
MKKTPSTLLSSWRTFTSKLGVSCGPYRVPGIFNTAVLTCLTVLQHSNVSSPMLVLTYQKHKVVVKH